MINTSYPFYGRPRIYHELEKRGFLINEKKVYRMMKLIGIEAIYPKPDLSKPDPLSHKYPYLLKHLKIDTCNQVWGSDITYIKMLGGFMYLYAIIDWYSRLVVSWRLSNTLETDFCIEAFEEALRIGKPEISNTDQGCQFTSKEFTGFIESIPSRISMDGRGRCYDNIFTERLWRSLKYEEVYLKSYESVSEARESIGKYFDFYNNRRLHQSLNYSTPASVYFK